MSWELMFDRKERFGWGNLLASHGAPLSLSVDGEGLVPVVVPDLVDVRLVVVCEEIAVENDAIVGAQSTNVSTRGITYDQRRPAGVVGGILGLEARADSVQTVGPHARNMLSSSRGIGQGQ